MILRDYHSRRFTTYGRHFGNGRAAGPHDSFFTHPDGPQRLASQRTPGTRDYYGREICHTVAVAHDVWGFAAHPTTNGERQIMDLGRLATTLEIINSLDPGSFYLHHLQILLTISEAGAAGCTYGDIEVRHGLSNAAASRSVNALSSFARHRKSAMGLVEIIRDPNEGRRYRCRLTSKGQSIIRSIEQL